MDRYTRAEFRTGRPQVNELIAAARVPVFLLDENQIVRPGELGSVAQITTACQSLHIDVDVIHLGSQFRCGGSDRRGRGACVPRDGRGEDHHDACGRVAGRAA